ncbi:AbrB family transcriptional regulator [Pyruvatibacter mobilis]|jgi:membrane AbrB-like protein|uniref:AbrB family transcriptional regulator n=1 Tax=Pyruvatibacter mobilis TaxID=1712261 RepID=UPI003BAB7014
MSGSTPETKPAADSMAAVAAGGLALPGSTPPAHKTVALTLTIATAGGALFAIAGAPLAWMLGAMFVTTGTAMAGLATLGVYAWLRTTMIAVLGVMLGSAFTPDLLAQIPGWWPDVLALGVFVALVTAIGFCVFHYGAGYDTTTAYFSATPGGLSEMAIMGHELGADIRTISLIHATRILVVVATIPVYFRVIEGLEIPALPRDVGSLINLDPGEGAILAACALLGVPIGKVSRVPAGALIGPMVLSAAVHLAGWSSAKPPAEIVAAAQVVVGASIGCRFAGLTLRDARRIISAGLVSGLLMVVAAALTAYGLADILGRPADVLALSFAPGGLAEMALIALILGIDTAFVSAMHVMRIAMVVIGAPLVFRLKNGQKG